MKKNRIKEQIVKKAFKEIGFSPKIVTKKDFKFDVDKYNKEKLKSMLQKVSKTSEPKVLYLSTYKKNYTRTEVILNYLEALNIESRVIIPEGKGRYFKVLFNLLKFQRKYDVIFVSFRGHEILPFIRLFTRKPIVFDAFVSVYDTLCFDRKKFKPRSMLGRFLKGYDSFLCKISDLVLVDTKVHSDYFKKEFHVENVDFIYVSCNKALFYPKKVRKHEDYTVFWYGNALPVQGVSNILSAAEKVYHKDKKIIFKVVGPVKKKRDLPNVEYINWIPYSKLPIEICKSHLCIGGHFSNINKAKRVIAGKTFQFLECNIPTLVNDVPANREVFQWKKQV